tara:strand:- start:2073 stop:3509 length:1437 start_codon:yes stop_codon:yes gene_type:complete
LKERIELMTLLVMAIALLAAVACGDNGNGRAGTQPPVNSTPIKSAPPAMVQTPAPIEDLAVVPPETVDGEYVLKITSGLPNGCAVFDGIKSEPAGDGFNVSVTNLMPAPGELIACTEIYGYHESEIGLGSGLIPGEEYTVAVNDDLTYVFTPRGAADLAMVEKESSVESIEVVEGDGGFVLAVVSRLPKGSSCSRSNAYQVNRRFEGQVEVKITHAEVTESNIPCTADLPVLVTEIPLGGDYTGDKPFVVAVNGGGETFPKDGPATVETLAPIEDTAVVAPGEPGGEYVLKVTSGLPSGCAQFSAIHVARVGSEFQVDVTNLMPNPNGPIACTAIYGYFDSEVVLGGGLMAGEAYTVTINGDLTNFFTVPSDGRVMVEKEAPFEEVTVAEGEAGPVVSVVSRLPKGSSSSSFNGYSINRRFAECVEITVTHREVAADDVPCTRDLSAMLTEIPLGENLEAGRVYTVSVNGEETTFTAR